MLIGGSVNDRNQIIQGKVYSYRYIDHGAQFRVYEILTLDQMPTGRVVKIPIGFNESREFLLPHLPKMSDSEVDKIIHQLMIRKQQLPQILQGMYANDDHLMKLLGQIKLVPTFTKPPDGEPNYFMPVYITQNLVMPMSEYIHKFRFINSENSRISLKEIHNFNSIIKQIVKLHYHLWENGIFDLTLKLENIGVTNSGVVLVDPAEFTTDIEDASRAIEEKKWLYCMKPNKTDHLFLPIVLHNQYVNIMDRAFTKQQLMKIWQKRKLAIERNLRITLRFKRSLTFNSKKRMSYWVQEQMISNAVRRGLPAERIDTLGLPAVDLITLLADKRDQRVFSDHRFKLEQAERTVYENNQFASEEAYRFAGI